MWIHDKVFQHIADLGADIIISCEKEICQNRGVRSLKPHLNQLMIRRDSDGHRGCVQPLIAKSLSDDPLKGPTWRHECHDYHR